jgi:histidyl-tRNA synthetase
MANRTKFQAIKGTRDLLPPETEMWNRVEQTAREVFGTFGFGEIRPPIFEPTELFARAVGGETDIVSKEMYTFEDHDFAELERLRTDLVSQAPDAFNAASITLYNSRLAKLIAEFEEGIAKRGMPATPENNRALENLRVQANHMRFLLDQIAIGAPHIQFDSSLDAVRQALRLVRFGDVISLRPEATASVCRAYVQHGMQQLPQPVKLYYTGPMFRRERPQKGRYRQFYQIGAEVLEAIHGDSFDVATPLAQREAAVEKEMAKDAATDAEVIEMVMAYFTRLGLDRVQLEINSIGHSAPECRLGYVAKLRGELEKVRERLKIDSQRRIETNPLRVLDSKVKEEQEIIERLPRIGENLCADCARHFGELKRQLGLRGVVFQENWRLVRGLDYYMRTTFEITAQGLGSQNAVCGGGRYDGLVELLGGPPTKGIGFAIGEDRLILSLQEAGKGSVAQGRDVYIAWMGEKAQATAIAAARTLRNAGLRVELPPVEQKFGKALGQADKLGSRYALILGEDEVASGQWTVKTLADGSQAKYAEGELVEFLRKACSSPLKG